MVGPAGAGRLCCGWSECVHGNSKTKARVAQIQLTEVMEDLSEEHQALYTWIDEIPLSRQKKHVARDFSDGGKHKQTCCWYVQGCYFKHLVAEVPKLVSSLCQKKKDSLMSYLPM